MFGRKDTLLCFLGSFVVGCALIAAASNMAMLVAGRAVQGIGAAGCFVLCVSGPNCR